ncbi:MAG: exonuclease domain-containing protein [archaeon]
MFVIDLEFSGLDPERHSIISLGVVDFFQPSRTLYLECRLRPGSAFDEEAFLVHGLSKEYLEKQSLSEQQLVLQFLAWVSQSPSKVWMGQSPWKDVEFLSRACDRYSFDWPFGHRFIDLHSVAVGHYYASGKNPPLKNGHTDLGLDRIAEYCGIPPRSVSEHHNALTDAKLTADCFSRLLLGKGIEFSSSKME